jgi:hypothetical protein
LTFYSFYQLNKMADNLIKIFLNKQLTNETVYEILLCTRDFFGSLEKLKTDLIHPIAKAYKPNEPIRDHIYFYILMLKSMDIHTICTHYLKAEYDKANKKLENLCSWLFLPLFDSNCVHYDEHDYSIGVASECLTCKQIELFLQKILSEQKYINHCFEVLIDHDKQIKHIYELWIKSSHELDIFKSNLFSLFITTLLTQNPTSFNSQNNIK